MLSPVLTNLVLARKQRGCLRLINCCIGRFYGRCPNPQFLKKLSKLFCFWEDNLALAKFQSPTDTPLNHNLLMLSQHLKYNPKIYFNLQVCLSSSSACKNIRRKPTKSNMQLHQIVYCFQNPIIKFSITAPKAKKNITP